MFLASNVLIGTLPLRLGFTDIHCHLITWLGLVGIPCPFIEATVFAKMLRIYVLFSDPLTIKKKLFTDPFLFLYILLLTTPNFIILLLWSSTDPYTPTELEFPQQNFVRVQFRCLSEYTSFWLSAIFIDYCILSAALVYLALKTSKIRYKHFQDAKATNAFVYLSQFFIVVYAIYRYYFRDSFFITILIRCAAYTILISLCQILLFIPKVYPPLRRKLTQNQVKSKKSSTDLQVNLTLFPLK